MNIVYEHIAEQAEFETILSKRTIWMENACTEFELFKLSQHIDDHPIGEMFIQELLRIESEMRHKLLIQLCWEKCYELIIALFDTSNRSVQAFIQWINTSSEPQLRHFLLLHSVMLLWKW